MNGWITWLWRDVREHGNTVSRGGKTRRTRSRCTGAKETLLGGVYFLLYCTIYVNVNSMCTAFTNIYVHAKSMYIWKVTKSNTVQLLDLFSVSSEKYASQPTLSTNELDLDYCDSTHWFTLQLTFTRVEKHFYTASRPQTFPQLMFNCRRTQPPFIKWQLSMLLLLHPIMMRPASRSNGDPSMQWWRLARQIRS